LVFPNKFVHIPRGNASSCRWPLPNFSFTSSLSLSCYLSLFDLTLLWPSWEASPKWSMNVLDIEIDFRVLLLSTFLSFVVNSSFSLFAFVEDHSNIDYGAFKKICDLFTIELMIVVDSSKNKSVQNKCLKWSLFDLIFGSTNDCSFFVWNFLQYYWLCWNCLLNWFELRVLAILLDALLKYYFFLNS
jgi:hypothetical protein